MNFAIPAKHWIKLKESKKWDRYIDLVRELKKKKQKTMEHEGDLDTNCNWWTWNNSQRIDKGTRQLRHQRIRRNHQHYIVTKISQNTEKSPGDMM